MPGPTASSSPTPRRGRTIATLVLKPQVAALLEVAGAGGAPELRFEEIVVTARMRRVRAVTAGARPARTDRRVVVAVRRPDGVLDVTPAAEERLGAGDVVIAMGSPDQIGRLEDVFAVPEPTVALTHRSSARRAFALEGIRDRHPLRRVA